MRFDSKSLIRYLTLTDSRKVKFCLPLIFLCLGHSVLADPGVKSRPTGDSGKLPLSFEANGGQTDPHVKFLSRGKGFDLFLTDSTAVLTFFKEGSLTEQCDHGKKLLACPTISDPQQAERAKTSRLLVPTDIVRMELLHPLEESIVQGEAKLPGAVNYIIGNDPAKWHTNLSTYARVRYRNVYHGIDLLYYGNKRQLEYDFVLSPHASSKDIRLHFTGAKKVSIDTAGNLILEIENARLTIQKPKVYQICNGERVGVDAGFGLSAEGIVTFRLGSYRHDKQTIIDPTLIYSTYLGGSSTTGGDTARAIAVDEKGSVYVTGSTQSIDFPVTKDSFDARFPGNSSSPTVFVTKLNPAGSQLIYSTFLGGSGDLSFGDLSYGIALDNKGNAYVTGNTYSINFPVTSGAFQKVNLGGTFGSAFVTKVNPSGSSLVYSTYLGATSGQSLAAAIAVDSAGNAFVAGSTTAFDFPVTPDAFQKTNLYQSAFVTKFNTTGSALIYSTYLGGSGSNEGGDQANGLAIDKRGNAYVAGETFSNDFPVSPSAFQRANHGFDNSSSNAFVTELNPSGSGEVYSTYLGGSGVLSASGSYVGDSASAIAVDMSGNAYITGSAWSTNFPVTKAAFQRSNHGKENNASNAFVAKFSPVGASLAYSTYVGGSGLLVYGVYVYGDSGTAIALDPSGGAYITGSAFSLNYPVSIDAFQKTNKGGKASASNAFLSHIDPTGSDLLYSTYFGGDGLDTYGDGANAIAVDSSQSVYIAGQAFSPNFPVTPEAFQKKNKSAENLGSNAFVARFSFPSIKPLEWLQPTIVPDADPQRRTRR